MSQPEQDSTFTQYERSSSYEETRANRRQLLGEYATGAFTLLPEAGAGSVWERDFLKNRIIGQDDAIDAIISALDRAEVRPADDFRPIAKLAFLGPTGVGKTETARVLSEALSPNPNIIRIDCSGFSHGHEIASLTGSPPGYVGHEQKPVLSKKRIEKDGTVVLFDEIEKGSPQLTNLLLQIMDSGLLELNDGTVVSFRKAVVILTSNLGAREMAREAGSARAGFGVDSAVQTNKTVLETAALKAFKQFFSPEFVNRLDDMVVFHPLEEPSLHEVLEVKLNKMNDVYIDDFGAFVNLSEKTRDYLVKKALAERAYGVRPLVRALEKDIASSFGSYLFRGQIQEGTEVYVYHREELGNEMPESYKGDLVFASRPDATIKKKEPQPVVNLEEVVDRSTSTDLVVDDTPKDK